MQYKKHDEYKDSEAPWIGNIPSHWDVKKIGQCFQHRKEKVSDKDFEPLSVTMQGIVPQLETAAKSDSGDDRKKVCVGDFVINSRSDRKGSSGVSPLDGSVSLISIILKPLIHDKGYIHHLLRSFEFQEEFYRNGKGIVADLWSTKYSEMKNIKVPLPSTEEQKAIAEFIDKKTSQIDTHIDKQERLIALLKERRTAIINKAVTRGLDENVNLKDSGVDLFGEIPEHWEVKKLKYIAKITLGKMLCNDNKGGYQLKPYLKSKNIGWLKPITNEVDNMWFSQKEMTLYYLKKDDLLVSEGGEVGKTCIWDDELEECYIQNSVHKVTVHSAFSPHFYLYYFYALGKQEFFKSIVNQVSIGHLTKDKLSNIVCICPPIQEQKKIVEYIKKENLKINTSIAIIEKEIFSLKEYRQSLISNAVTGKIRVI